MHASRAWAWVCAAWVLGTALGAARADVPWESPPGELPFIRYDQEPALRSNSLYALAQDSQGHLWVSASGALLRHDGRRFQPVDTSGSTCQADVSQLLPTPGGGMACLSSSGMSRWRQGRWERFEGLGKAERLEVDREGRFWVTTDRGLLQGKTGGTCCQLVEGWPAAEAHALWVEPSGEVYASSLGALHRRGPDGQWQTWSAAEGLPPEIFLYVARDGEGNVWLWNARATWVLPPGASTFQPGPDVGNEPLYYRVVRDVDGTLWRASNRGLIHIGRHERVRQAQGLPNTWLRSVLLDREGSLWAAGQGLYRLAGRGLWRVHTQRQGLPSDTLWAIHRDSEGTLWAGTQRGLARASAQGWEPVRALGDIPIRRILSTPEGALWLAGPGEVLRYMPRTGELIRMGPQQGLAGELVLALAWHQGTLWVGTTLGLFRSTGSGFPLHFLPASLPSPPGSVRDLRVDSHGRLWATSDRGLAVLERGTWRLLTPEQGLLHESTRYLVERSGGELCVSYGRPLGLTCFHYQDQALREPRHLDKASGLTSNVIYMLGTDTQGRLWVGTDQGVDRLPLGGHQVEASFSTEEGMPGNDCDAQAFLADPGGNVWIGTSTGLGQFLGQRDQGPPPAPTTVLYTASAGGLPLEPHGNGLELPYTRHTLEAELAALTFLGGGRIEYQARVLGLEQDFQPLGGARLRYARLPPGSYTLQARSRLPRGEWGPPVELAFVIAPPWWRSAWLFVTAPLALGALGLVVLRLRQRALLRRNAELEQLVALRTRELTQAQQRLVALEKAALEQRLAGGFAHEMRNALTGAKMLLGHLSQGERGSVCAENGRRLLQLYLLVRDHLPPAVHEQLVPLLQALNTDEERVDTALRDVEEALTRALSITRHILEYAQLGHQRPGSEPVPLRPLVEAVLAESRQELAAHAIALHVDAPEHLSWRGDPAHLYSILKNLVLNARDALLEKQGPGERRLRVALQPTPTGCLLQVEDSGTGIAPEHQAHLFEPFFSTKPDSGTGLGLAMVSRLVSLYEGSLSFHSLPGQGTTFTVNLPHASPQAPEAAA